ncbi:hypothetical protein H7C18_22435 [Cohnella sp. CBP 2801]|uniref:AlgX/AlgJ SGNH hydrolase-like domain-containing protein n=1 Tax=Cohnella zeiphila TaxID=2761120 RepID=A0A7X0VXQ0_9BACL|nr:hypothetical protein [Cohnella zeiphila]
MKRLAGIAILLLLIGTLGGCGSTAEGRSDPGDSNGVRPADAGSEAIGKEEKGTLISVNADRYLILGDRAFFLFTYSAAAAEQYADALNRFREAADPQIRVYSLLAPTSAEFVDNDELKRLSASQQAAFAHIGERLDSRIVQVDAYGALKAHKDEYLFFRTDHHWTALGAYYAYVRLMETMDEQPVALDQYKTGTISPFLGSDYKATKSERLGKSPDSIAYYVPFADYAYTARTTTGKTIKLRAVDPDYAKQGNGDYAVFLGGDFPSGEIETGSKNGRKLLVVKDSYANALIPFLIPHFETIGYIDPRYFHGQLADYVKRQGITDVLFLDNSTVARTNGMAKLIEGIL